MTSLRNLKAFILLIITIFIVMVYIFDSKLLDISSLALIITAMIVFYYTKFTYDLLRSQEYVSASFNFHNKLEQNNLVMKSKIKNYSKYSIETHCKLEIHLAGEIISYDGYYNDEWSISLQPHGNIHGYIKLKKIFKHKFNNYQDLQKAFKDKKNIDDQSFFIIVKFWYRRIDVKDNFIFNPVSIYMYQSDYNCFSLEDNGRLDFQAAGAKQDITNTAPLPLLRGGRGVCKRK